MFINKACELAEDLDVRNACFSIFRTPCSKVEDLDEKAFCLQLADTVSEAIEDLNKEAADLRVNKVSCYLMTIV